MLKNFPILAKLCVIVGVFAGVFLAFGLVIHSTLTEVQVNGPAYKRIVQGKDLVADVLPPPAYVVESYLLCLQLLDPNADRKGLVEALKERQVEYENRHSYWEAQLKGESGEMKTALLEQSYGPARKFFAVIFDRFVPALEQGRTSEARELAYGELKEQYLLHRKAINDVVRHAVARNEADETSTASMIDSRVTWLWSFGAAGLAGCLGLAWWVANAVTNPLHKVLRVVDSLSKGNLARRTGVNQKDEIGLVAQSLDRMADDLSAIMDRMRESSSKLVKASEAQAASAAAIGEHSKNLTDKSSSVATAGEQLASSVGNLSEATESISQSTTQIAAAIEEMSTTIREVSRNCASESRLASEAHSHTQKARNKISELDESAREIGKVLDLISTIAEQTNLLALNATIEAASAGEAGRGFAVVAGEVKELARQSAMGAEQIAERVRRVQSAIGETVSAMAEISELIHRLTEASISVSAAVEEQSAATNEIAGNVGSVSTAVDRLASTVQELSAAARDVSERMKQVDQSAIALAENASAGLNQARGLADLADAMRRESVRFNNGKEGPEAGQTSQVQEKVPVSA